MSTIDTGLQDAVLKRVHEVDIPVMMVIEAPTVAQLQTKLQEQAATRELLAGMSYDERRRHQMKAEQDTSNQLVVNVLGSMRLSTVEETEQAKESALRLSGLVGAHEYRLEEIQSLTLASNGDYSFVGLSHTWYEWEYNYNAGWGRSDTRTVIKVTIPIGGYGSYEVLSNETHEGRA